MFHFLKKTIMVPDFMARQAWDNGVVISKWDDYEYSWPVPIIKNHIHCAYYETFEQWYQASFENDLSFIQWVYNTREDHVRIYADSITYAKFVIKWLKFICPSLTVDQVYKIYKLSVWWFYVHQVNMRMNTNDTPLADYPQIIENYKTVSYSDFQQYFEAITFDDSKEILEYKSLVKNYISNEFKFAFFLNGDSDFEDMTKEHVDKALVRCLKMELNQYRYVKLIDIVYDNAEKDIKAIDDQLFTIIKNVAKTKPSEQLLDASVDELYHYGMQHDKELLIHNNILVDDYYNIVTNTDSLQDKLKFIANIAKDGGVEKSEFVDCFSSSYMLYNLLFVRWVFSMYMQNDPQLKNFVY